MAHRSWSRIIRRGACMAVASSMTLPALANGSGAVDELKGLSIDELLAVEITSVSRREESLRDAAAAIAVIRDETLRTSGAQTVPDALRLVPGIHVAEQTANSWT